VGWGARLGLVLASLIGSAALAEGVARGLAADERFYDVEMWRWRTELRVPVEGGRRWAHRPGVDTSLYGVPVRTNEAGLRQPDALDAPGRRVLLLGDSIAFAWGVRQEEGFAARLPALLADLGPVRVLNTGVPGYGTVQEVAVAEELGFAWQPEVVLLAWFVNDAEPVAGPEADPWWFRSRLALLVSTRLDRVRRARDAGAGWEAAYRALHAEGAPGRASARAALARLGEACARRGVPGVVALMPELHVAGSDHPLAEVYAALATDARAAGLAVVDTSGAFPAGDGRPYWVSAEDAHPSGEGHRRIAEAIAPALRAALGQR